MENRELVIFIVPLFLVGLFVLGTPSAAAYGVETHAYLTSEVINFYNQSYSDRKIPDELRNYLIDGSRKEDEVPRWLNHFYDPVYDRGLNTSYGIQGYKSKTWAQDASKQKEVRFKVTHFIASLLTAAEQKKISEVSADPNFTWNRAIEFYIQGDKEKAMFALGHVLHLIEDAGVPDHTRNDDHPEGSPYENFAKRFNLSNSNSRLSTNLSGRGTVSLNNLDAYFNSLANYSNNNFYSKDTIGIQSGYNLPQPVDYEIRGDLRFARGQEEGNFYKLFAQSAGASFLTDFQGEITVDDEAVMIDYWNHLSPKVVQHGAGVVNLFFQEAEKAKNDPKFAKKEKKNFLTEVADAAKTAFDQIFNKADKKPVAVIDVNQENQQALATNSTPTVSIDKTTVARGETLIESGQGFSPNSDVSMQFDLPNGNTVSASIKTDAGGSFQKNYVMPGSAPLGQYVYYAEDSKTGATSNKLSYTVKGAATKAKTEKQEVKKAPAVKEEKKEEAKQVKTVKQSVQECSFNTSQQPSHNKIIINEVAWMGGLSSAGLGASDEWVELKNLTTKPINISGWQVVDQDENIQAVFKDGAEIPANGFYLLERTNDSSVPGITADAIYSGALANSDEGLRLFASDCTLIDEVLAKPSWPGGDNSSRRTMQRTSGLSWSTYGDSANNNVLGTPRSENGPALVIKEGDTTKTVTSTSSASTSSGSGGGGSSGSSGQPAPVQVNVLITEVQITGGPGQTDQDFVEIYNHTSSSVNLNGHRLVKRTKIGTSDTSIKSWTSDTIIPAGSYYLWANSNYSASGTTPDITTSGAISNDNGVAIRFGAEDTGTIVDSVGWGEAANAFVEGSVFATNPGANESIHRKTGSGYIDTGNNASDFQLTTCPSPKAVAASCGPANQAPVAVLSFSPASPTTADTVGFTGASSSDSDGSISYYSWNFGDGNLASSTSATTTHTYSTAGSYIASLTVFDNQNSSSTASTTITIASPAPAPSVLFQQADNSGGIAVVEGYNNGSLSFPLGSGADGSANKLKVRFKPEGVTANSQYYMAPWRIKEIGGLELGFWYAGDLSFADQPKYCFTTAETGVYKDITFTFASPLNFLASKTYNAYLLFLRDIPGNVCANNGNTGTGSSAQGTWVADAANSLIYFQIGN